MEVVRDGPTMANLALFFVIQLLLSGKTFSNKIN